MFISHIYFHLNIQKDPHVGLGIPVSQLVCRCKYNDNYDKSNRIHQLFLQIQTIC